jgi:hypothetical protein
MAEPQEYGLVGVQYTEGNKTATHFHQQGQITRWHPMDMGKKIAQQEAACQWP